VGMTPLHRSALGNHCRVLELLLAAGADPTIRTAKCHEQPKLARKVAYELATDKAARNVFRRAMADAPERCDWVRGAMVPSPLTKEDEERQKQKKAAKGRRQKQKKKSRKKEQMSSSDQDDAVLEEALGEKKRLLTAIERKREAAAGLNLARALQEEEWAAAAAEEGERQAATAEAVNAGNADDTELERAIALSLGGEDDSDSAAPEEDLHQMRERRRRAAEARREAVVQSDSADVCECGVVLSGEYFSRDGRRFCSTACVQRFVR